MFTALLDTCVLWPSLQRDFLLSLAIEGMYRPTWSSAILEELEHEEAQKLTERGADPTEAQHRAHQLVVTMNSAFNDAEVQGWEGLEGTYGLPDPDDEHVLAAAVVGNAVAIVTHNTKDFPQARIPIGIHVLQPSEFAANTVELNPASALIAVEAIANRSGRHGNKLTVPRILDVLADRYGMAQAVDLIRPLL